MPGGRLGGPVLERARVFGRHVPMSAIDDELARARRAIRRITAHQARAAQDAGALVVDIRDSQRRREFGRVPGALEVEMTALEWRLDPTNPWVAPEAADPDRPVVLMCNEGYASSLAAERVQRLGRRDVADVIEGFAGWVAAGLPVRPS